MKKLFALIFFSFLAASANQALAQVSEEIINQQNRLLQRSAQFEEERKNERELQENVEEKKVIELEQEEEDDVEEIGSVVQKLESLRCFRINEIRVLHNDLITDAKAAAITSQYEKKCLSKKRIIQISEEIQQLLFDEGYVNSKARLTNSNFESGLVEIVVLTGVIEEIIFAPRSLLNDLQVLANFGELKKGKTLNIKEIEKALKPLKSMPSSHVKVKIAPGKSELSSIVIIENDAKNQLRSNLFYDNYGNKITGEKRENISVEADNIFRLNDSLSLFRTANDLDERRKKQGGNNSFGGNFSLPLGSYKLSLSYSNAAYFFWQNSLRSAGETSNKNLALEKFLIRNDLMKMGSTLGFAMRNTRQFINDERVEASSRKSSILNLELPTTFFLKDALLLVKPSYSKGLSVFDAKKDDRNLEKNSAKNQFDVFKIYANYSRDIKISDKKFALKSSFIWQRSSQSLYAIDRISMGGIKSVRGFKEGTISGDFGYGMRSEISANLGDFDFLPLALKNFSLAPFYDYGHVESKYGNNSGRLAAAGLGLSFKKNGVRGEMIFSKVLSRSHLLGSSYQEKGAIFFNLGYELGFF